MVNLISNESEFDKEILSPGLVVIDYFATWCWPCQRIAPFYEELSGKHPTVKFFKVDVDDLPEVAEKRNIRKMPTFQFFVDGTMVDEFSGFSEKLLVEKVLNYKGDNVPSQQLGRSATVASDPVPLLSSSSSLKNLTKSTQPAFGPGSAVRSAVKGAGNKLGLRERQSSLRSLSRPDLDVGGTEQKVDIERESGSGEGEEVDEAVQTTTPPMSDESGGGKDDVKSAEVPTPSPDLSNAANSRNSSVFCGCL